MTNAFIQWIGHPKGFGSFNSWVQLLRTHKIPPRYWGKVIYITLMSAATSPLRLAERRIHGEKIQNTQITEAPVFILGHWRSGTTYLHQLLIKDPQFGYITLYQNLAPEMFLVGRHTLKPIIALLAPKKRPTGDLKLEMDNPEEEDFALSNMIPESFYHHLSYPRARREFFDRYVLFQGIDPEAIRRFTNAYMYTLKAATYHAGGKQLVTKSPPNTGRIPFLLEQFPNAKFIHIYRNPYAVFYSTYRLYKAVNDLAALQHDDDELLIETIFYMYEQIMHKYFADVALIPEGNIIDVKYETLVAHPVQEMQRIYEALNLGDFEDVQPLLTTRKQHKTRKTEYDDIESIRQRWGFTIERWGYDVPH